MNILRILKSKYKVLTTKEEDLPQWVKDRRIICNTCPLNSKHIPITQRGFRWYKWWFLNNFNSFCSICGCGIKPLTMSELESCKDGKWDSEM